MRLTTPEGDMWRVDVAMTACGSVLEARIVPPGCVGPTRKCGAIFLELYLLGALESVLKLSPYDDGPKVPVQVLFGYFS